MKHFLKSFADDQSGATAIEYGLIAALIAMGIIAGAGSIGNSLSENFNGHAKVLEDNPIR